MNYTGSTGDLENQIQSSISLERRLGKSFFLLPRALLLKANKVLFCERDEKRYL
jgi:hypothetical protein